MPLAERCNSVYHLPLPLEIRCTQFGNHDEHRSGWMRWRDSSENARRLPSAMERGETGGTP